MAKSIRDKLIEALERIGETRVKSLSRKIVYTRKEGGFYYLGPSGSFRFGQTSSASIPVSNIFKVRLLTSVTEVVKLSQGIAK